MAIRVSMYDRHAFCCRGPEALMTLVMSPARHCLPCGKPLQVVGLQRKNGAKHHSDWDGRKFHPDTQYNVPRACGSLAGILRAARPPQTVARVAHAHAFVRRWRSWPKTKAFTHCHAFAAHLSLAVARRSTHGLQLHISSTSLANDHHSDAVCTTEPNFPAK